MTKKITATEASRNFSEVLARVQFRHESFLVTRHGKTIAQLRPPQVPHPVRIGDLKEVLSSLPILDSQEAQSFDEDLAKARRYLKSSGDPWAS